MKTLIHGGQLIDPANKVKAKLNILLEGDKVAAVTSGMPEADRYIDATGKIVTPGFIDIHMHEDPVGEDGKIVNDEKAIFQCMLRMGVTTALGGQCGDNVYDPGDYLDLVERDGAPVNVGMLAGHGYYRHVCGVANKYGPASEEQMTAMAAGIEKALDRGCFGVSYGIRYVPGIDMNELTRTAEPCRKAGKMIAAHIRSDAEEVYDAAREFMDTGVEIGIPVQLSHIGSMAGFGQMEEFLKMVDEYKMNGLDVSCDCYPYYAYSTSIGTTTYDDGWMERYNCDYDVIELCEGKYKGQRCTKEIFEEMRRDFPGCLTVCHVMCPDDVDGAFRHPNVMLASDGILNDGQGHPRAAGAFPRLYAEFVRPGKLDLYKAVSMMTSEPAAKMGLVSKGRLNVGADADVVIFDLETIQDGGTFGDPILPPKGIDYVFIGGEIAAKDCQVVCSTLGKALRK